MSVEALQNWKSRRKQVIGTVQPSEHIDYQLRID